MRIICLKQLVENARGNLTKMDLLIKKLHKISSRMIKQINSTINGNNKKYLDSDLHFVRMENLD